MNGMYLCLPVFLPIVAGMAGYLIKFGRESTRRLYYGVVICLTTALLQPNPPSTILIAEPELGLHPEAIHLLAEMLLAAARQTQIIIATQSPLLLDNFSIDDIVVCRCSSTRLSFAVSVRFGVLIFWMEFGCMTISLS